MKMRTGFVSNSSTSSFCIYGIYIDMYEDSIKNFIKRINPQDDIDDEDDLMESFDFCLDKLNKENGIELTMKLMDSSLYIGREWRSVKNDETGKQFKDSIEQWVKEYFPGEEDKCGTHEEAWRDG